MSNHLHYKLLLFKAFFQLLSLIVNEARFQFDKVAVEAFKVNNVSLHLEKKCLVGQLPTFVGIVFIVRDAGPTRSYVVLAILSQLLVNFV